jgi:hypothetical protein
VKTSLLTPYDRGDAKPAGKNLFRKQLLPFTSIDYKGRTIDFTRDYLAGLVKAFNDRAYDQVAFQLADAQNTHTEDPERFRGEIAALELTDDGLDVIVAATDDGAKVLRDNPRLGVSAKIVEDYGRADGKFFTRALKHVLGTLDPRMTGMAPWEAVDAANDEGDVVDLTALEYASPTADLGGGGALPPGVTVTANRTGTPESVQPAQQAPADTGTPATEEHEMALSTDQEARLSRLLDLPEDQFTALLTPPEKPAEGETDGGGDLTDAQLEELVASIEAEVPAPAAEVVPEKEKETVGASLNAEAQAAIDLANARADETAMALKRVTTKLATAAYEAERDVFARTYGIPPRITDLARGLLEGEGRVVELANGKTADAGSIVREVLKEFGRTVKVLDLSGELGSAVDGAGEAEAAAEQGKVDARNALVSKLLTDGKYGL